MDAAKLAQRRPTDPKVISVTTARRQQVERCYPMAEGNPPLNTFLALLGYVMAYMLFTTAKTAAEPIPKPGVIAFTSRSEGEWVVRQAPVPLLPGFRAH